MRLLSALVIFGLCLAHPALSQTAPEADATASAAPVDRVQAADAAAELKEQISSARMDVRSEADEQMQAQVDQMGALATLLEAKLREGQPREQTELVYQELRRARLEAIGLAMSGKAKLPAGAAEFDAELRKLERYQRGEQ